MLFLVPLVGPILGALLWAAPPVAPQYAILGILTFGLIF
jgi:hypothetical protein